MECKQQGQAMDMAGSDKKLKVSIQNKTVCTTDSMYPGALGLQE